MLAGSDDQCHLSGRSGPGTGDARKAVAISTVTVIAVVLALVGRNGVANTVTPD